MYTTSILDTFLNLKETDKANISLEFQKKEDRVFYVLDTCQLQFFLLPICSEGLSLTQHTTCTEAKRDGGIFASYDVCFKSIMSFRTNLHYRSLLGINRSS